MVLAAYAVNPDKEADYEKVIATLEGLVDEVAASRGEAAAGRVEDHQELGERREMAVHSTST